MMLLITHACHQKDLATKIIWRESWSNSQILDFKTTPGGIELHFGEDCIGSVGVHIYMQINATVMGKIN